MTVRTLTFSRFRLSAALPVPARRLREPSPMELIFRRATTCKFSHHFSPYRSCRRLLKEMFRITRWARQYLLRMPSPARPVLSSGFQVLDRTQPIEEERYKWYKPEDYYPVRIGEIFKDRYQVLSKLGYGAYSTVWLCRDLK